MSYTKVLESFLRSGKDFAIIYKSQQWHQLRAERLLVLDSSFNPPHLAHLALARQAMEYEYSSANSAKKLVLLLSVKNADKVNPAPALFDHRLAMIELMAHLLELQFSYAVSIALTNHAKFVDKSTSITDFFKRESPKEVAVPRLTFLLGFDTLIRVLDPKYYSPLKMLDALHEFMATTDMFALTRADDSQAVDDQLLLVHRIESGEYPETPSLWARNIIIQPFDESQSHIASVSSSSVRQAIQSGQVVNLPLLSEVVEYIKLHKLYET